MASVIAIINLNEMHLNVLTRTISSHFYWNYEGNIYRRRYSRGKLSEKLNGLEDFSTQPKIKFRPIAINKVEWRLKFAHLKWNKIKTTNV